MLRSAAGYGSLCRGAHHPWIPRKCSASIHFLAEPVPPLSHPAWSSDGAIRAPGCRFTPFRLLVCMTAIRLLDSCSNTLFFHVVGGPRRLDPLPPPLPVVSLIGAPKIQPSRKENRHFGVSPLSRGLLLAGCAPRHMDAGRMEGGMYRGPGRRASLGFNLWQWRLWDPAILKRTRPGFLQENKNKKISFSLKRQYRKRARIKDGN